MTIEYPLKAEGTMYTRMGTPVVSDDATWPFLDEEDMPDTPVHIDLISYLALVLKYQYRTEGWYIAQNSLVYGPATRRALAPDIAVCLGFVPTNKHALSSYRIAPPSRPAPAVAFEIASEGTWELDFDKLPIYARWGIGEVYIYDPGIPRFWHNIAPRIKGYQLANGQYIELPLDALGRLRSAALGSYLVPDGDMLRLTDLNGNRRLTGEEAAQQGRDADRIALDRLLARLREHGIDPDSLV